MRWTTVDRRSTSECCRLATTDEWLDLVVLERGENGFGETPRRCGIELDGDALASAPHVDAQRVVERRVLRVVEVHDGAVDAEPVVAGVAAAGHISRRGHVGAHLTSPGGVGRRSSRSASSRPWPR